jgi:hypothetical protein
MMTPDMVSTAPSGLMGGGVTRVMALYRLVRRLHLSIYFVLWGGMAFVSLPRR